LLPDVWFPAGSGPFELAARSKELVAARSAIARQLCADVVDVRRNQGRQVGLPGPAAGIEQTR